MRIAHDPSGDVRQLAMADIDAAIQISGYRETVPEKISDTVVKIPALPRSVTPLSEGTSALQAAVVTIKLEGGHGSGFFISRDGYLLTNHHVVGDNKFVTIKLTTGRQMPGEVLRSHKARDIALVKVNELAMAALPLQLESPEVAAEVYAVGTPRDEKLFDDHHQRHRQRLSHGRTISSSMQSDAAIHGGSSGGRDGGPVRQCRCCQCFRITSPREEVGHKHQFLHSDRRCAQVPRRRAGRAGRGIAANKAIGPGMELERTNSMTAIGRMAALHVAFWQYDPLYRRAWFVWPQVIAILLASWLLVGLPQAAVPCGQLGKACRLHQRVDPGLRSNPARRVLPGTMRSADPRSPIRSRSIVDRSAFRNSAADDQPKLAAALGAYYRYDWAKAIDILKSATASDPNVQFVTALALMIPNSTDQVRNAQTLLREAAAGQTSSGWQRARPHPLRRRGRLAEG